MKYVILDTNIYIDILFDRNRNVKKSGYARCSGNS